MKRLLGWYFNGCLARRLALQGQRWDWLTRFSVQRDCLRKQAWSAISVYGNTYQCQSRTVPEVHLACRWYVKQPRESERDRERQTDRQTTERERERERERQTDRQTDRPQRERERERDPPLYTNESHQWLKNWLRWLSSRRPASDWLA